MEYFKNKKIGIVYGGKSEAEVSRWSAEYIAYIMNQMGIQPVMIEFSKNISQDIAKISPDIVFNAMHGTYGEDGRFPAILDILQIPYTHSGVLASAIGMNKPKVFELIKNSLEPDMILDYFVIDYDDLISHSFLNRIGDIKPILDQKEVSHLFAKPLQEGSSVGCFEINVKNPVIPDNIPKTKYIIQEAIQNKIEYTTGIYNNKSIGTIRIEYNTDSFDYETKYLNKTVKHIFEENDITERMNNFAEKVHKIIEAKQISRVDFIRIKDTNIIKFLEINTHPGFTKMSLIHDILAKKKNISNDDAAKEIIINLLENASFDR